jgi:hypothetical protein
MPPECDLQLDALEELLDQNPAAELSQADPVGSPPQISRSTADCCRTAVEMRLHNVGQGSHLRGIGQGFLFFFWSSSRRIHEKAKKLTSGIGFAVIELVRIIASAQWLLGAE